MDAGGPIELLEEIARGAVGLTAAAVAGSSADLTFTQWRVLVVVGGETNGVTISELAQRLRIGLSPASRLVSRLRARRLVLTGRDQDDRRATRVVLTSDGMAIREAVIAARRELLTEAVTAAGGLAAPAGSPLRRLASVLGPYS